LRTRCQVVSQRHNAEVAGWCEAQRNTSRVNLKVMSVCGSSWYSIDQLSKT